MDSRAKIISGAYSRLYLPLEKWVARQVGSLEDARDIVQDTALAILTGKMEISTDAIGSLFYKVAHNKIVDYMRRHACRRTAREFFESFAPKSAYTTDEAVAADECWERLSLALSAMPDQPARAFSLYLIKGCDTIYIAREMGISERTAENHIYRARTMLRQSMFS